MSRSRSSTKGIPKRNPEGDQHFACESVIYGGEQKSYHPVGTRLLEQALEGQYPWLQAHAHNPLSGPIIEAPTTSVVGGDSTKAPVEVQVQV
jgi:hypothetical protein